MAKAKAAWCGNACSQCYQYYRLMQQAARLLAESADGSSPTSPCSPDSPEIACPRLQPCQSTVIAPMGRGIFTMRLHDPPQDGGWMLESDACSTWWLPAADIEQVTRTARIRKASSMYLHSFGRSCHDTKVSGLDIYWALLSFKSHTPR